jgi:hypothetical protein
VIDELEERVAVVRPRSMRVSTGTPAADAACSTACGAGHIERAGTGDFITTAGEFVLAGMLIAALGPRDRSRTMTLPAPAGVGLSVLRRTNTLL